MVTVYRVGTCNLRFRMADKLAAQGISGRMNIAGVHVAGNRAVQVLAGLQTHAAEAHLPSLALGLAAAGRALPLLLIDAGEHLARRLAC